MGLYAEVSNTVPSWPPVLAASWDFGHTNTVWKGMRIDTLQAIPSVIMAMGILLSLLESVGAQFT